MGVNVIKANQKQERRYGDTDYNFSLIAGWLVSDNHLVKFVPKVIELGTGTRCRCREVRLM